MKSFPILQANAPTDGLGRLWFGRVLAALVAVTSIPLIWGGVTLAGLGGSPYYLIAGLTLSAVVAIYWFRRVPGLILYGLLFVATLAWAVWESGLNGWWLLPRLDGPVVLGLLLLLPQWRGGWLGWTLLGSVVAVAAMAAAALFLTGRPSGGSAAYTLVPYGAPGTDWASFGGTLEGQRYSPVAQITPANIGRLERVWTFHTGVTIPANPTGGKYSLESTPLKVGDNIYICTSDAQIIAIDVESGRERWRVKPRHDVSKVGFPVCRGVSYYAIPGATGRCARRIYHATIYARLVAVDAGTGASCSGFGKDGEVDLTEGMGPMDPGPYHPTSPPTIVAGKVLVGGLIGDNVSRGEPSGVVRAFDAVTGAFVWAWDMGHPDRQSMPPEGETYTRGTPNVWATISADPQLGLAYLPTGNETPDFFGGGRHAASEKYSSSLVAVDVNTGRPQWSFQTTHHDIWDYDLHAQPVLFDFGLGAKRTPAVFVPNKRGQLFILDRRTGRPLVRTEELPVPGGAARGDWLSPTQPFATGMPALTQPNLTEASMWGSTPLDQLWCRITFRRSRYEGAFTPQSTRGSVLTPGSVGIISAHGVSLDPRNGILITNATWLPHHNTLIPRGQLRGDETDGDTHSGYAPSKGTPYGVSVTRFLAPTQIPCGPPPWGKLFAIDLNAQKVLWQQSFGDSRDSGPFGLRMGLPLPIGVVNSGGSVTTAGGVTFIGASTDSMFRAFDVKTGALLWNDHLPASALSSPSSFVGRSGRQFVVITASGHSGFKTRLSDAVIAYALPLKKAH